MARIMRHLLSILTLALALTPAVSFAQKPDGKTFAVYQLPEAKRIKLPNGLVILLLEKHELPLTSISVTLRSGSLQDPDGKPGESAITEELLRRGTETKTAAEIAEEIDFIGMQFGGGFGGRGGGGGSSYDSTEISADFMAKDTDKALGIVADVVLHPAFPQDELTKVIAQRQEQLKTEKDNVQGALGQYFLAALYAGHPYSRSTLTTSASLASITRDDIVAFYKRVYTPANAVIAVAGDFNAAQMEVKLKDLFGAWKGVAPAPVVVPAAKPVVGKHVILVDKPDATQTYFMLGNIGISQTDPDRAPVRIVNTLFGGRFTSMFNEELRVKSGYSYGASSSFGFYRTPGPFIMSTYTRNATTEPAIDKTFEVLAKLHTHPLTDADLTSAKNYMRGTFPPSLETTPALVRELGLLETEGISRAQFNKELVDEQATTLADANRVIDQHFPSDNYVLVIIGKASEIGSLGPKYGQVTAKKITDPGF
jgi:predicted Zn-dependent peptidase